MYPMVHTETRDQRQPHIALIGEQRLQSLDEQAAPSDEEAVEENSIRRRHRRPLHRRFFTYVREAWTGVKSALGKVPLL